MQLEVVVWNGNKKHRDRKYFRFKPYVILKKNISRFSQNRDFRSVSRTAYLISFIEDHLMAQA